MKKEIEATLLGINEEEFIGLMKKHNATFVGDWLMNRNCYDFNPVDDNKWIRLRTTGEETTLTIKEIINDGIEGTKELEIAVSDFALTNEILNKLGYHARSSQTNRQLDIFWMMLKLILIFGRSFQLMLNLKPNR